MLEVNNVNTSASFNYCGSVPSALVIMTRHVVWDVNRMLTYVWNDKVQRNSS